MALTPQKVKTNAKGEMLFQVGIVKDLIILEFGQTLNWIAFNKKNAQDLISIIQEKIDIIEGKKN
jgi:hypothetical protein